MFTVLVLKFRPTIRVVPHLYRKRTKALLRTNQKAQSNQFKTGWINLAFRMAAQRWPWGRGCRLDMIVQDGGLKYLVKNRLKIGQTGVYR